MSGQPYTFRNPLADSDALVQGETLLAQIFPVENDRPSLRWLQRLTASRTIPSIKLKGKRFYRVHAVREAIKAFEIAAHE
jgi:hypothetical protein